MYLQPRYTHDPLWGCWLWCLHTVAIIVCVRFVNYYKCIKRARCGLRMWIRARVCVYIYECVRDIVQYVMSSLLCDLVSILTQGHIIQASCIPWRSSSFYSGLIHALLILILLLIISLFNIHD